MSSPDDHDDPLKDIEARLDKYDAVIARLDALIDVLTRRVEAVATRAEQALDGQSVIEEKADSAHRYAAIAWSIAGSGIVGTVGFLAGYVLHR